MKQYSVRSLLVGAIGGCAVALTVAVASLGWAPGARRPSESAPTERHMESAPARIRDEERRAIDVAQSGSVVTVQGEGEGEAPGTFEPCTCLEAVRSVDHYLETHVPGGMQLTSEQRKIIDAEVVSLKRRLRETTGAALSTERSRVALEKAARGEGNVIQSGEKVRPRLADGTAVVVVGDGLVSRAVAVYPEEDYKLGEAASAHSAAIADGVKKIEQLITATIAQ